MTSAPTEQQPRTDSPHPPRRGARVWAVRIAAAPELPVSIALLVLLFGFSIAFPDAFATMGNARNVVADSSTLVILAMAAMMVILTANIDLSIGSVVAFSEVVAVKTMVALGGGLGGVVGGLAAAVGCGLVWGCVNGFLVARIGLPPLIVTLATFGIALGAAQVVSRGNDLTGVPIALVRTLGNGMFIGIPAVAFIGLTVFAVTAWTLRRTRFGRYTYAIGSDRKAAERAGINARGHIFITYVMAGGAYGLVAFLNLARFGTTAIGGHLNDALNAITAVALGGTSLFGGIGTALGSLVGVLIPAVLQNGLVIADVQPYWQQIAVGVALLFAIYADHRRRARQRRN